MSCIKRNNYVVIHYFFFYFSVKIFVATGFPSRQVEIINVLDPDFKYQFSNGIEYTIKRWSAVGGLVQNQPVICGGTRNANEELKDVSILGIVGQKIKKKSPHPKNS